MNKLIRGLYSLRKQASSGAGKEKFMLIKWLNGTAASTRWVREDADRFIATFRERAYLEARDRVRGRCIDGDRPARHWTRVKLEIARRQRIEIGFKSADKWMVSGVASQC